MLKQRPRDRWSQDAHVADRRGSEGIVEPDVEIPADSHGSCGVKLVHHAWHQLFHSFDRVAEKRMNMGALRNALAKSRFGRQRVSLYD